MKKLNLPFGQGVQIHWLDSSMSEGWDYGFKPHLPGVITTLGLVTDSSDLAVTISSHIAIPQKGSAAAMTIPWASIMDIDILPENFSLYPNPE